MEDALTCMDTDDIHFINQIYMHEQTYVTMQRVVNRIVLEINVDEHKHEEDLEQDCYLESIRIIRSFWRMRPNGSAFDEWLKYFYASLYKNLKHLYLTKYLGYKYNKSAPKGKRYSRRMKFSKLEPNTLNIGQESNLIFRETKSSLLEYIGRKKPIYASVLTFGVCQDSCRDFSKNSMLS
jgi:hypothetical protein